MRTLLAVAPLVECRSLVEMTYEEGEGGDMSVRDLLALLPLSEARPLFQGLREAVLDMSVRDLTARYNEAAELREGMQVRDLQARHGDVQALSEGKDALPDLREILDRLRRLHGLDVAPLFQRYHLRLAELYYRKGRRTEFETLKQAHLENKLLERRYRATQEKLKEAYGRGADVAALANQLRDAKRTWVLCENKLSDMREPKTKVETFLESMRLKLLAVLRNPARYLQHPARFQKLERRLVILNQELERDNDMHREIGQYSQYAASVRRDFHALLSKAESGLRSAWRNEAAKKDGSAEFFASRTAAAVVMLVKHYRQVLGEPLAPQLALNGEQMLIAPISLIQYRGWHVDVIDLYRKRSTTADKQAAQAAAYAKQGYALDLERVSDPHALAAVVLHHLASIQGGLLPHSLLQVGDADELEATRLFKAAQQLRALPNARLVQIRLLFSHLRSVVKHWKTNHMTAEAIAGVFAPLLFVK